MKGPKALDKTGQAKDVFDLMYPDNTASCYVCHNSARVNTPYGKMYVQEGGTKVGTMSALHAIESLDADNDGINNGLEIRTGTDPNVANTINGMIGNNPTDGDILLSGSNLSAVSVTPVQDVYSAFGVELNQGQQLMGQAQFTYTQSSIAPVTVAFTKASAYGTVKVHELTSVGSSKEIPSTITSFGNVTFTASTTSPKIIVESGIDPMESPSSGGVGCFTSTFMPVSLFFILLLFAFKKRK